MDSCDRLGSIRRIVSSLKAELTALSDAIWAHPETAFQEKYACAALSRFLAEKGFSVEPARRTSDRVCRLARRRLSRDRLSR